MKYWSENKFMPKNKINFDQILSRSKIYLVIIAIILTILCIIKPVAIIPSIIAFILIVLYTIIANQKRKAEISDRLNELTLNIDKAAQSTIINSPFPLIVLETDGNIIWRSSKFVSEFEKIDMNPYLDDLIIEIKKDIKDKKEEQQHGVKHAKTSQLVERQVVIGDKTYRVSGKYVKSRNDQKKTQNEYMLMLYFIDITENLALKQKYQDTRSCVEIIMIDNYEENMQLLDSEEKPQIIAEIDKAVK
mgnify:CR=1 FL=1